MTTLKGPDPYAEAEERLAALFAREADPGALHAGVCRILHETVPTYSWVGIYLVEGDELVLVAWQGPRAAEHARTPLGRGICGAAAASRRTVVVDDVSADPRYLARFASTRAEIAVPIQDDRAVYGEIDIASDHRAAFGPADRAFLEATAGELAARAGALRAGRSRVAG